VVDEIGWSSTPWLKCTCKEDLRKTMSDQGKSMGNDSRRVVKEMAATGVWPMMTRTKYAEWALLMQVKLEGMEVWDAIDPGGTSSKNDHITLEALLRGVPPEMWSLLAKKKTAKEALEAVKSMQIGSD
jgi:hypothetical protein